MPPHSVWSVVVWVLLLFGFIFNVTFRLEARSQHARAVNALPAELSPKQTWETSRSSFLQQHPRPLIWSF